jgi:hypothetical protein
VAAATAAAPDTAAFGLINSITLKDRQHGASTYTLKYHARDANGICNVQWASYVAGKKSKQTLCEYGSHRGPSHCSCLYWMKLQRLSAARNQLNAEAVTHREAPKIRQRSYIAITPPKTDTKPMKA